MNQIRINNLVPELYCSDFQKSLEFYTKVAGFSVAYSRPEERFAYLEREGAQLMIEQTVNLDRIWLAGPLEHPYGRGINLQIKVSDVKILYETFQHASIKILVPLEEKWYRKDDIILGNLQFVALDPDGYLLRLFHDLGLKPSA